MIKYLFVLVVSMILSILEQKVFGLGILARFLINVPICILILHWWDTRAQTRSQG